jgi:hypothetical protein
LSSSAQRQLSEFVYPFATNSDRGGLTDIKSIALPQLSNADSAEAVEVEAKRSVMRPYPIGSRGREMSGDHHDGAIGEGLEEAPPCRSRRVRVDAEAAIELRLGALQRRMHDITAQDHGCMRRPNDARGRREKSPRSENV